MKKEKIKKSKISIVVTVFVLVVGVFVGIWQFRAPKADETLPEYQQMMKNLYRFAEQSHPSGSAEINRVRSMIIEEIEDMGVSPLVESFEYTKDELITLIIEMAFEGLTPEEWWAKNQKAAVKYYGDKYNCESFDTFINDYTEDFFTESVFGFDEESVLAMQNILVKLDAPGNDRGIMFVSHYDSASEGPGAGDDMISVCAMLEAIRAQSQNSDLKNDIYFLITDGEEVGTLGAMEFVKAHPEMRDKIDMIINLEARGNRGGLLLFETSENSYEMIKATKKSGAKPIGVVWAVTLYAMMPNTTDLTIFFEAGYKGINLAAVEGVEVYHEPTDTPENFNKSTAGQYLNTVMSIADYCANNTLDSLREPSPEAVYFTFLPGVMVLMTALTSHIICGLACLLAVVFLVVSVKNKQLKRSTGILMGILIVFAVLTSVVIPSMSYLFYIPLLTTTVVQVLKKWHKAFIAARIVSGFIALLIWVPAVFLVWVLLIEPLLL